MTSTGFRVLYREFLFRMLDLELFPQRGDITKLLGQFGAMLAALSVIMAGGARQFADSDLPRPELLMRAWPTEDFLIATTMAVVGVLAVLAWDSTFPDRRDVLVLAPLPVRAGMLFRAKLAALATTLTLTVLAVNVFTGLAYPLVLGTGGFWGGIRCLAAFWITMFAAGGFVFCCVLGLQGLAAQVLSRHLFLRASGFLQMGAFILILAGYFLEPPLATPVALAAPENHAMLAWLPQYWFVALFQLLNGSLPGGSETLLWLERRAWIGLAATLLLAAVVLLLAYSRTLKRIAEEPDILPGARRGRSRPVHFSGSFRASPFRAAILLFTARSIARSRQHRVILALYLGIGSAVGLAYAKAILWKRAAFEWTAVSEPLLAASIVVLCFAVLGVRVVFPLPLALGANWIFRITELRGARDYFTAVRLTLLALAVAPVCVVSAALLFSLWPWQAALGHLVVLVLVGSILSDLCLHGFYKIPFACSYLPGKANLHVTGAAYLLVFLGLTDAIVKTELHAGLDLSRYVTLLVVLSVIAILARLRTERHARVHGGAVQYDELAPKEIFALELHRDGAPVRVPLP